MSDDGRRPWRARPLWPAMMAVPVIAMLAVACGGGSSSSPAAGGTTAFQRELAYAVCVRAHGDPGFPDPQSDGTFNSTKANRGAFGGPVFASANKACAHPEGPGISPAQQEQLTSQALRFAACMRAHGIAGFRFTPPGQGHSGGLGAPGASPASPQFRSAQQACRKLQPPEGGA
jgi:hypothetical protein